MQKKPWLRVGATAALVALIVPATAPLSMADEANPPSAQSQTGQQAAAGAKNSIRPDLSSIAFGKSNTRVKVMVMFKDQPAAPSTARENTNKNHQSELLAKWSEAYDLQVDRQFGYLVNGFSATIPAANLLALQQEPEVATVQRERVYQPLDDAEKAANNEAAANAAAAASAAHAGAPATDNQPDEASARVVHGVPTLAQRTGADGTGTVVAVIDSGIDASHRDLKIDDCSKAKIQKINPNTQGRFTCKVPNGFNYADQNYEIWDSGKTQHGQHVAGIVGANGLEDGESFADTGRIEGIAPNAQILAMKVFPKVGGGASDSDILAAIEDSVKLGADVINMSLGSSNGQREESSGMYTALEKAREMGVIPVVSAGNSGQNFSPTGVNNDALGIIDDGLLGSPSSMPASFSVASIENTTVTRPVAVATIDDEKDSFPYGLQSGEVTDTEYEVVDAGLGKPEDFTGAAENLEGKAALMQRGEITFAEKYKNAAAHGASAVIIYNHETGGDEIGSIGGVDAYTFTSAMIGHSYGAKLSEAAKAGKSVTIRLTNDARTEPNAVAGKPSTFTSWGATSSLDFKPRIAGIGGEVYSLQNDNKYTTMSGTSMAAPNVAGMASLLTQVFAERYPQLPAAERPNLIETALMNTAEITANENGVPYAPRQIGAGLARVDRAADTQVYATVEGKPWVALRQVNAPTSFQVTLTNHGTAPATYAVPAQKVVNETNNAGEETTTFISNETLTADISQVTVPAGGTATVTFTLTPDASTNHFVEGWARFESTGTQPDLAVPYLGFAGDWNAEPIVKAPGEPFADGIDATTALVTNWAGMTIPVESSLGTFWLSPNGDGDIDVVAPNLMMMRNASDVEYEVLDANGNYIKTIGQEQYLRRSTIATVMEKKRDAAYTASSQVFDGHVWNAQKGDLELVPDGKYIFRVKTRLSPDFDWQIVDMPFGVDTTAPVIKFGEPKDGVVELTVTENGSGIMVTPQVTDPTGKELTVTQKSADPETGVLTFEVTLPEGTEYVTATVMDHGFNMGVTSKVFAEKTLVITSAESLSENAVGPASPFIVNGKLKVQGFASSDIAKVDVNGVTENVENGRFNAFIPVTEGTNPVTVIAYDANGNELTRTEYTYTYDATPPTLELTGAASTGTVELDSEGKATITGTVKDERAGAKLTVRDAKSSAKSDVAEDGSFTLVVTPKENASTITVVASDGANTTTETVLIAGRTVQPENQKWTAPTITNANCTGLAYCAIPTGSKDFDGKQFIMRGKAESPLGSFTITPQNYAKEDGTMADPKPIEAQIGEDGTFTITIPASTGLWAMHVTATDKDGKVQLDQRMWLQADAVMPTISFTSPEALYGGALFTNEDSATFAGTANDDGFGYTLSINDSKVIQRGIQETAPHNDSNAQDFSHKIAVKNGDSVLIAFRDAVGNALAGLIPVVVDKVAPEVTIDGIADNALVREATPAKLTATDDHLASMRVLVNGEEVSSQSTDLAAKRTPVEGALAPAEVVTDGHSNADKNANESTNPVVPAGEKSLSYDYDTSALPAGTYTVTVESADLAGNVTAKSITFVKDAVATISGPDSVAIEATADEITDQAALAAKVLAEFTVMDDGAAGVEGETTLALAPGTVLLPGDNTVNIVATDAAGNSVIRTVTVTITAKAEPQPEPGDGPSEEPGDKPGYKPGDQPARVDARGFHYAAAWGEGRAAAVINYGNAGDEVFFGDWNGDGIDTPMVRRGNRFLGTNAFSGNAQFEFVYGDAADRVIVGDWDGDGKDSVAVVRGNVVLMRNALNSGAAEREVRYGNAGDVILAGNFDADAASELVAVRGNKFYIQGDLADAAAPTVMAYGNAADRVIVGDWNGDGIDGFGVVRGNKFLLRNALSSGVTEAEYAYGNANDAAYIGDWNGDGVDTVAVDRR
ncbi:S8 family serine peptidase [Actinobaculum massiliense]|uniref:S8 family serine peptidase n=1 Tax=Actinobaculum massiliense TaxID=202789 RepID=UPI0028060D2B|nr:S8 family serine peptidase [Actinobaculum massiliense]